MHNTVREDGISSILPMYQLVVQPREVIRAGYHISSQTAVLQNSIRYGAVTGCHIRVGDEENVPVKITEEPSVIPVVKDRHDLHLLSV